jgi:hypothetical protein
LFRDLLPVEQDLDRANLFSDQYNNILTNLNKKFPQFDEQAASAAGTRNILLENPSKQR